MVNYFSRHIVPLPEVESEILEIYRDTHAFYEEVRHRQAFEDYCQWYDEVAAQHRKELETMRREINMMGWFCRRRSN